MTYTDNIAVMEIAHCNKALAWIFITYRHRLCAYAEKITRCPDTAEDIVQDFFEKLIVNRKTMHIISLKEYLFGSISNLCLKHLKHNEIKREHGEYIRYTPGLNNGSNNPETVIMANEVESVIRMIIAGLPAQCREVYELRETGLSYSEVAERLGVAVGTVGPQYNRAITKLRKAIKKYLTFL